MREVCGVEANPPMKRRKNLRGVFQARGNEINDPRAWG